MFPCFDPLTPNSESTILREKDEKKPQNDQFQGFREVIYWEGDRRKACGKACESKYT